MSEPAADAITPRRPAATDVQIDRALKGPGTDINLHVHPPDSPEIARHLLFRDWLRTHDDDRAQYERTKRELASRTWKYMQNYADAKTEVIELILAKAAHGTMA
jgi:GrpB-like predicted nucleotidyltransferase (UPF0157 family)